MLDHRSFYIDGAWRAPAVADDIEVLNPATEERVALISNAGAADVEQAVAAARRVFDDAAMPSLDERIALLERLQALYRANAEELAQLITLEMGAPITFSRDVQVPAGEGHIETTLEELKRYRFSYPSPRGGSEIVEEPIGVCAMITPWNWPINQIATKVLPALAVGCSCVLKPSELSPLSAMLFARMIDEAGWPAGAFNLVNGYGPQAGAALSEHRGVDMVSFTGSTRAGIAVSKAGADTVKRVALELGGKSPNLVFADADLEQAARFAVDACFANSGQSCDAPTRLLVQRSVHDRVLDRVTDLAREVALGDPRIEGGHLGPVVSEAQLDKIQRLISTAVDEGARLVVGGPGRPEGFGRGYFVRPTVFADVGNEMTIAREEVFGPVLAVLAFDDEDDAVRIANDTVYGLAAYIQTRDFERASRVARRLRAGAVSINGAMQDFDAPFGGYKQSGNGREYGVFGIKDFLELKTITRGA